LNSPEERSRSACSFQTVTKGGNSELAKFFQFDGKFSIGCHCMNNLQKLYSTV
jgi:hypothetical protein